MKKITFSDIDSSLDLSRDVFVHPTNSSYGIGASIYNEAGYNKIYDMKQRNKEKPFFITVSDISNISEIAIYDERIDELISLHPEKTFTFILHRAYNLPEYINPGMTTIGVQIASGNLLEVSKACGGYMFGTSANISGKVAIFNSSEIESQFQATEDTIFLDAGDLEIREASTIIDLTQSPEKILRGSLV